MAKGKKKKASPYGVLFRFLCRLFSPFLHRYRYIEEDAPASPYCPAEDAPASLRCIEEDAPVLYLCRHQNMRGPVKTLTAHGFRARPLVLSVFFSYRSCARQYREYTFSARGGMPRWLAAKAAALAALFVVPVVRSLGAIPVYRENSLRPTKTVKETVSALAAGDSCIIYPDVDYVAGDPSDMRLYPGFLLICRYYEKKTGKPLCVRVLKLLDTKKAIAASPPLSLSAKGEEEKLLRTVTELLFEEKIRM